MRAGLWFPRLCKAACLALAVGGCSAASGGESFDAERSDDTSRPVIGNTASRWNDPTNIRVCFVNGDGTSANERFIRELVTTEYAQAGLCFTGWSRCSSNPPCPTIRVYLGVPSGRNPNYGGESYIGAVCQVPAEWTMWLREDQLDHATIHEFGHAIGLRHEHARTDNDGACPYSSSEILPEDGGNQYYTVYDPNSVMNYCGQDRLTQTDIQGIMTFYGTNGPVQCDGGAGPGTSGSGSSSDSSCQYACADFGMVAGECGKDQYDRRWECDGTCLVQVQACGQSSGSGASSDPGSGESCQFACADYNYQAGQCHTDANGNSWYCDGACLEHVSSCN